MILVDTSIWIDHLHSSDDSLIDLLNDSLVATHPMVIGELAVGSLRERTQVLSLLAALPGTAVATHAEVLALVNRQKLFGVGFSLVDAHLLAAALLTSPTTIWTRDRRLSAAAERLQVSAPL